MTVVMLSGTGFNHIEIFVGQQVWLDECVRIYILSEFGVHF